MVQFEKLLCKMCNLVTFMKIFPLGGHPSFRLRKYVKISKNDFFQSLNGPIRQVSMFDSNSFQFQIKFYSFLKVILFILGGPREFTCWILWQHFSNIYEITGGISKLLIFWLFMDTFRPNFSQNLENRQKFELKIVIKSQKMKIFKIPPVITYY